MHFGFWQQGKTDRKCKSRRERERDMGKSKQRRCRVEDKKDNVTGREESLRKKLRGKVRELLKERSIKHAYSYVTLESGFNRFGPPKGEEKFGQLYLQKYAQMTR